SVLPAIRKKQRREYDTTLLDDDPTTGEALEQILAGKELNSDHAHQYGYALKMLCKHLGKFLGDLTSLEWCRVDSPLEQPKTPFGIPESDDFPVISYLTDSEAKTEASRLASMDLSSDDQDVEAMRQAYLKCMKQAAQKGVAVISSYH
ncbi:MAG: hypothetical protein KJZ78_19905, partial [Bryobacteraceae bacterium]|nr:hypothetical protein [Bryobacteraceae bacterium]